jgi:hypothetical protein
MRRTPLVFLCALAFAAPALATVVARLTFTEIVAASDRVVEGRVESTEAFRSPSGIVATRVQVAVERGFRGVKAGERLTFAVAGGELGRVGLVIPGMPRFEANERCILFLTAESSTGMRAPVGLGQGKLRVEVDEKTGVKRLTRSIGAVELLDVKTGKTAPAPAAESFDYAAFTAEVEKLVAADDAVRAKKAPATPKGGK